MPAYISLLRGINVAKQNPIRKDQLIDLFRSLGFENVAAYLQSGNVVFTAPEETGPTLGSRIEAGIRQTLGYAVSVLVHGADYFQKIAASNPFLNDRGENPSALHVTFLYQAPDNARLAGLTVPPGETGEFALGDQALYLFCPDGYGRTKLSNTFFERKLGVPATTRNWNTVNALYEMGKNVLTGGGSHA